MIRTHISIAHIASILTEIPVDSRQGHWLRKLTIVTQAAMVTVCAKYADYDPV